ncbi:MAG: Hsp20/alpha crystallin family protein [Sphaerochaetaceae bacterium]|nr:Hsp20/alpha crystallin family protein [Sphaerochaetaceae bacterium]
MNYMMNRNAVNDFDKFFDNVFSNWGIRNSTIPSVDVYEDEKAFHIEAELPGYEEKDVNLNVDKHVLHISSEKVSEKQDDRKYLVRERAYVKFDRSFSLPEGIDENGIEAEFKNGMLSVTLPKVPVEEPKKISITFKH